MTRRAPLVVLLLSLLAPSGCDRCSHGSAGPPPSASSPRIGPDASRPDPLSTIHWDDTPIDWSRPLPQTPAGGVAQEGYVGSDACKDCHRAIYDGYARHSMARTGIRPLGSLDPKWLERIFAAARPVQHERSGFWYRPYRDGKKFFMEEYLLAGADEGSRVQSRTVPLEYAYSAGSYGVAFYFRQGGRMYQVPLDYYPQVDRWGIDPGAREGNPRFSKALETFCVSCHADYPRRRAGTEQVFFDPIAPGVGCERCHGPGARHVQTLSPADVVNPTHLPAPRQLDVCAQCHESNESGLRADRDEFSFRPGEPFSAYRVNFVAQPAEPDRFILLAHPERMVESACWKKSAGKLVCTSCHDPHKSSFEQPASWWDAKCNTCHAEKACTETAEARAAQGGHCVTCHMRRGTPTSPTLVTITDHWIQRRPPPVRPGSDLPSHVARWPDLVGDGAGASGDDVNGLEALALSRTTTPDDAISEAVGVAGERLHLPTFYEWLGSQYLQRGQPWNAVRAVATVLRFAPDRPSALLAYARTMLDRGDPAAVAEAMHALDRMLALDPDDAGALETKATTLFRAGQVETARPLFARAAAASPSAAMSHVALAVLARREGHDGDAIAELEAARAMEPADPWILDALATAYAKRSDAAHAGNIDRARKYFSAKGATATNATRWLPEGWR